MRRAEFLLDVPLGSFYPRSPCCCYCCSSSSCASSSTAAVANPWILYYADILMFMFQYRRTSNTGTGTGTRRIFLHPSSTHSSSSSTPPAMMSPHSSQLISIIPQRRGRGREESTRDWRPTTHALAPAAAATSSGSGTRAPIRSYRHKMQIFPPEFHVNICNTRIMTYLATYHVQHTFGDMYIPLYVYMLSYANKCGGQRPPIYFIKEPKGSGVTGHAMVG